MSERWKMNRMGFVNFWLYDEEVFEFEDGRLLLRGQNGSGKSITTQSFIPFILDGDRTPSRLDPFGSSDRKMDYYFLGDGEKEESTGYLFLEFKKESTGQYRTIGIGQRARHGASMTFWGFVLKDGRRIGYDLNLYKEVGSTRLPYSKADLKKLLGADTPFTDSPREYKEMVNKYIFGFRRMEQYEQFIRLLVKVRAPKLSKEFKPTKVYEILNESLQTLTDEELRAMVDAMEKMDSIQNNLERLKAAQKDAQIIQNEYTRYNQFMLARKAKNYLEARERVENLTWKAEAEEEKRRQLGQEEEEKREGQSRAEQRQKLAEAELESLKETDLDTVSERLFKNQTQANTLESEKKRWEEKAEEAREHLQETGRRLRDYEGKTEDIRAQLKREREELEESQKVLQFDGHEEISLKISREDASGMDEISEKLRLQKQKIAEGLKQLKEQEEIERQYDGAVERTAGCLAQTVKREAELERLSEQEERVRDAWIEACYEMPKRNQEFLPESRFLKLLEKQILDYQGRKDYAELSKCLAPCIEQHRSTLLNLQNQNALELERIRLEAEEKRRELKTLQEQKEWEPERTEKRKNSREKLTEAGISWVPFYRAVEFSPELSGPEKNLLEEQMKDAGLLDALVVARSDWERIRKEFPEYADIMLCAPAQEDAAPFTKLIPGEELPEGLKKETEYILRAISEGAAEVIIRPDGCFRSGLLEGRSLGMEESSLIGHLARMRRREQQLAVLTQELAAAGEREAQAEEARDVLEKRRGILEQEYAQIPGSEGLDGVLEEKKECRWYLEKEQKELKQAQQEEAELKRKKEQCFQQMLRIGRMLPYARTCAAYEEAEEAAGEYQEIWQRTAREIQNLCHQKELLLSEKEKEEQYEENQDTALWESRERRDKLEVLAVKIREDEEFLNRPENRQLANRLKELRTEKETLVRTLQELRERLAVIQSEKAASEQNLKEKKEELSKEIEIETYLRMYFEEELNLGLILEREDRSIKECAEKALGVLRESDRNREPGALADSLYQVYHKYTGSLRNYGIMMEECFAEGAKDGRSLRKRQRIVSVWNGKRLYFAQFCQTLRNSIEETELLIQEKDRELFVNILSRTISQQLTERIAESRQWIADMSELMKQMDTSMGLSFSLDWKPKTAENSQEMDTQELEKLLRRDQKLLSPEDVERVAGHFRSRVRTEKQKVEENGGMVNYMDLVRDALDYRKWFEFQMSYYRNQEGKKTLTNAAFNKFSGGEKAMAMYVPLFAAVSAQYQKSNRTDLPRIIALDEAFAGVDDKNIRSMFQLVGTLDFDYIMNSQAIWGCYETVPALRISELHRPADAQVVTVIHYTWNGHERILNEQ
ncbi:MAG: TIGR02680 family protein [Lachnospiraceae bacterium]|nr:TIGR02680 family protein [Lachnospiraceae bacterium]